MSSVDPTALYPFGHGLSYAPATWDEAVLLSGRLWPTDGTARVAVTLRNGADIATAETVQVYLHDPVAEVVRPTQCLIAAQRVDLAPGTARTVVFELHADLASYTGHSGRRQVDPGAVELRVGASSSDIRGALSLELVGPARRVGFERVMQPAVHVAPADDGA